MPIATITSKGQITIPKEIRESLGVHAGDRVLFWKTADGHVVMEPETVSVMSLKGMWKGKRKGVTVEEMNSAVADAVADAHR